MKLEELKALITKHTKDGEIDHEALNKDINTNFDVVIEKKVKAATDSVDVEPHKAAGVADFLKELGVESKEALKAKLENASKDETELGKKVSGLETDKATLTKRVGELETAYAALLSEKTNMERVHYATSKGNVKPEFADYVVEKVSKGLDKDAKFEDALTDYLKENKQYAVNEPVPDKGNPTKTPSIGGDDAAMKSAIWGNISPPEVKS